VIKKILKTKLTEGIILPNRKIKKDPGNITVGYIAFKVNKREDGWIEIKNARNGEIWAIIKIAEVKGKGRLYFGFRFRKPFVFFRPYRGIIKLSEVEETVRNINETYNFIRLEWTYRGGSKTGFFHFRAEIIDLFRFIRFLSPIPKVNYGKIEFPKIFGIRLISDPFKVLSYVPNRFFLFKLYSGKLIFRKVLSLLTGHVLLVKQIIKRKESKYEVLGGYIPNHIDLLCFVGILKINVWSCQPSMALGCIQGGLGKILELRYKKERGKRNGRQDSY
jgi:hypothetical protein